MNALGTHLVLELKDCRVKFLNDTKRIEEILTAAAREAKATIVGSQFHKFSPYGVSGMVVIAESHLSIHTWPEYGYAAVDIFTCGDTLQPEVAAQYLIEKFQSKSPGMLEVKRGILSHDNQHLPHKPVKHEAHVYARAKELQMVP